MPNFVNNTLTLQGEGQVAAAMAGQQMVITRVQVGSGVANSPLPSLISLVNPVMNLVPVPPQVSANNLQEGEVIVMATLDSAYVNSTFNLAELGVWATTGGGPEQLIVYCQCSAPYDSIAPGSGSNRLQLNLQVPIVVGVGASVSITVQAGNPVYVPPVVAGPGIVVNAPTDNLGRVIEWIVSTPQIINNTNLYVANENNDVAPNFSTLQKAMNYLSSFTIASGVQVTINIAAEQFNVTVPIQINHVNGGQILITGAVNPDVSFAGIGAISGSAGNWRVQLTGVSSTVNIKVGSWLNIYNVAFAWQGVLIGGTYQVLGVSGNVVTIQSYYYAASWPSMAGISGTMTPLSTILAVNIPQLDGAAVNIYSGGIGTMRNIALVCMGGQANNYAGFGLALSGGGGTFQKMGFFGFRNNTTLGGGFAVFGGKLALMQNCSASLNNSGFIAGGAQIQLAGCCTTHNLWRGVWADAGGIVSFVPGPTKTQNYIGGNRERGLLVTNSAYAAVAYYYVNGVKVNANAMIAYNASYGLHFINMSKSAFSDNNNVFFCAYNNTYDCALSVLSAILGSAGVQGSRVFNGTPGILTSDGCIFA